MTVTRVAAVVYAVLISVVSYTPHARADDRIECESKHGRYKYCSFEVSNRNVSVGRVESRTSCDYGRNWGYDRHGIWVDQGCAAEFIVRDKHGGHHNNDYAYDRNDHHGHDKDDDGNNAAVAVGAIAGIALIAAIASQGGGGHQDDVSAWAVGTFNGYDEAEHAGVEVTILPGGSVRGSAGANSFTGVLNGNDLQMGRYHFRIAQQGNGFVATDTSNSKHRVSFRRTGTGY